MFKFLRENWVWIVAPIVVMAVLLVVAVWLSQDSDQVTPFVYPL